LGHADTNITDQIRFRYDNVPYIGSLRRLALNDRVAWLVAAVVPEADFLAPITRANGTNVLISLILLVVALITSLFIARRVSRSLSTLVQQSREISRLSFEDNAQVRSPFREVNDVLDAFENMKVGLRSFQKYLPLKLVRRLLANQEEPELGGEFMEVTIFFSDIIDFTPINESMHPMEMAQRLGDYLASLTDEIETRQGTVVQYVGDEIMALWGAPQTVADHASLACRAALACQEKVQHLWDESTTLPAFSTRFGIHTAEVAVGHFGSTDRLYYGAIGDGINATSRIEGLNKFYGTHILISETTNALVSDTFYTRRIDKVAVMGKRHAMTVYELLGERTNHDLNLSWTEQWETAFSAYLNCNFSVAQALLDDFLRDCPTDIPAQLLRKRSQDFAINPPPPGWDGVHRMSAK
jgi:adenylate cyclase